MEYHWIWPCSKLKELLEISARSIFQVLTFGMARDVGSYRGAFNVCTLLLFEGILNE